MRRVGREGRAIVKSFSYPKSKDVMMEKLEELGRKENMTFSEIILESLERYWLEHGASQNPQTKITLFETGLENAMPNLYSKKEDFRKFMRLIKKEEELKLINSQLILFKTELDNTQKNFPTNTNALYSMDDGLLEKAIKAKTEYELNKNL